MWTLLFLPALATDDPAWSGAWTLSEPAPAVQQRVEAAVDTALAPFNVAIRALARSRLVAASHFCTRYTTSLSSTAFTIQCDGTASVTTQLDGTPTTGVSADGRPYAASVLRDGDQVELRFQGEEGWQRTRYRPTADGMLNVEKTLHTDRLGCDVTWTMVYVRG